ncbi:MAG: cob(I)yrinic acid a,c-diamide adenosyltransferase [Candidatus Harrisonbacteria bacterium CG10_big_fil_rev_8_21_14_0_10_40_38]|uniref:Cob(I)yrinic acid a,c-diamide adenosyltransferase n=1 Tax=Candidatus Harrisonbacteria bacterium CG10_big_fil_rev_8_21_14_0_10_40_38 TaxID=1974583 RepID=A0A2H0UUK6_9BACT|nr:MAG: cob(I)yrinic acid a,c-diamide adenosyltransferase [Candidatus Harrisonbacteria bacterium CG10_big_fil_rev_8_21_14_0_10_40_38]
MLIIFTGNGKGKTTAALGQAVRIMGRGKKALIVQCIKGPWKSGEDFFRETFDIPKETFNIRKMGLGFVGILGDTLPKEKHIEAAKSALATFKEALESNKWDLIVLDEVNVAVSLGLLTVDEVLKVAENIPEEKLVVFTGRGAPQEFIDKADLATEMREIKHPFADGKKAKISIEF